ncbi:glycerophosphodiester phosphodiesterase family protein [Saccharopolyspora endophytica]|uniref:Glycerophosphodiester phosphodiesterase n=1 Tax=Saccharopolyspora endophytica TaxID=543886 RepID=A0ABS5DQY2_9PSEU|nr:glycerophosphodiester phosphodiesterase family protein [Saccharopolyspora endophytica]MBQ0928716.1 glycerophosphodiester phosphodiesterase [Saccharopolyspora endophytica]
MTHPFLDGPWPRAFAHRGWHLGDLAEMENSLSAFRAAANEGYRYIETDVHATSDGVAVIHHDTSLDRTTDREGDIASLPFSEVSRARIAGREPVASLDATLEEFPDLLLNIDVKADSAAGPVLRTVRRHNAWDRVCLASFVDRRLTLLRKVGGPRLLTSTGQRGVAALWAWSRLPVAPSPSVVTSLTGFQWKSGEGGERGLIRGAAVQVPARHKGLEVVDERFVGLAHRWGVEVHVWTVDEPSEMLRLLDLGVDGLVSDRPDLLNQLLRERAADPARS